MGKKKKELGFDSDGAKKVMRKRDYMADMSGQWALGLMANVVGQLTYFYTDKVGLAVGGVGIVMAIAKVIDALTDIWFGNVIEHSKGGNSKFYKCIVDSRNLYDDCNTVWCSYGCAYQQPGRTKQYGYLPCSRKLWGRDDHFDYYYSCY